MHLFLRLSLFAIASSALVSCEMASSAANLLMAPLTLAGHTLGSIGQMAGAQVTNPDATSNSVAERGKLIEQRAKNDAAPKTTAEQAVASVK